MSELFSISNFVARVGTRGLARSNRFSVQINRPERFASDGFLAADEYQRISFNCESAELPGRDLQTTEAKIYGPSFKMPYASAYGDASFTFLCDSVMFEKRLFDEWVSMINPIDTFDFRYRDSYVTTVEIAQLTDDGEKGYACTLIEAYPIQVVSVPVQWGDDNFQRVKVTMTYRYWKPDYQDVDSTIGSFRKSGVGGAARTSAATKEIADRQRDIELQLSDKEYRADKKLSNLINLRRRNDNVRQDKFLNQSGKALAGVFPREELETTVRPTREYATNRFGQTRT